MLRAPIVYFGGKHLIARDIWSRFGEPDGFLEPFCGSAAVLLARPLPPGAEPTETINDADCMVANFWRAIKFDPEGVAEYADWPINEADVFARHNWLSRQDVFREKMKSDPYYYDIRIAGWWVWENPLRIGSGASIVPGHPGTRSKPKNNPNGIHGIELRHKFPGVFRELATRLRYTRVLCGDWKRCLTPVETTGIGVSAILFDPPYAGSEYVYGEQSVGVSHEVREWAIEHGDDPNFRIALCGYREHDMPTGWTAFDWKATGGYGNRADGQGRANAELERIWFSKHCIDPAKGQMGIDWGLQDAA